MISSDGEILCANQPFQKFLRSGSVPAGETLFELTRTPPGKLKEFLRNCSRSRQMTIGALRLRDKEGKDAICRCEGALLDPAGENEPAKIFLRLQPESSSSRQFSILTEKIAALNKEVLERRRAEEKSEKLYLQAKEASRLKDEFLATLSHELRTPLNAILGWARILRSDSLDNRAFFRALETIERNARSQAQLIEDLLDVSRIITGKLRLDVRRIDIAELIEAIVESVRPSADNKSVRLQTSLDRSAEPISGDAEKLQQAVWNLLSNAIKFSPEGGTVDVSVKRSDSHVEISVTDRGIGISEEFLPFVFERFLQADASQSRKYGGLGLGLAITRHIVELHGGTIEAHSAGEGKGATFKINLPVVASVKGQESELEENAGSGVSNEPEKAPETESLPSIKNRRLLIVDDQADTRDLLKIILESLDAEIVAVGSADEAFRRMENERFDVVISDIAMPGRDGYELIAEIRGSSEQRIRSVPAIALTAHGRAEDRIRLLSAGFDAHIAKPFEPEDLIAQVTALSLNGRNPLDPPPAESDETESFA